MLPGQTVIVAWPRAPPEVGHEVPLHGHTCPSPEPHESTTTKIGKKEVPRTLATCSAVRSSCRRYKDGGQPQIRVLARHSLPPKGPPAWYRATWSFVIPLGNRCRGTCPRLSSEELGELLKKGSINDSYKVSFANPLGIAGTRARRQLPSMALTLHLSFTPCAIESICH